MWTLAFAIYAGCKWLTWADAITRGDKLASPRASAGKLLAQEGPRSTFRRAPLWKHLGYLFCWPGMDSVAFLAGSKDTAKDQAAVRLGLVLSAAATCLLGIVLFLGVAPLLLSSWPLAAGWIGMLGVVLTLHFGLFHLLSLGWQTLGVDALALMDRPLGSCSLSEFWGRRWNRAFRDLTYRYLFAPLTRLVGPRGALALGFAASGLIHDLVISLPAQAGYGGPTVFFLIQGMGLLLERSRRWRRWVGSGRTLRGWAATMLILIIPLPLLFHPPFVREVIVPFVADVQEALPS